VKEKVEIAAVDKWFQMAFSKGHFSGKFLASEKKRPPLPIIWLIFSNKGGIVLLLQLGRNFAFIQQRDFCFSPSWEPDGKDVAWWCLKETFRREKRSYGNPPPLHNSHICCNPC